MSKLSDRLREARQCAKYGSATAAAHAFGWNENTYRSNENGSRPFGRDAAIKYARAFRVNVDWLLTGRGPKTAATESVRKIPIIGWSVIAAATVHTLRARLLTAEAQGFVLIPEAENVRPDTFALPVSDDSMVDPVGSRQSLYPGDCAIITPIDPDEPLRIKAGKVVLAKDGQNGVLRKIRIVSEGDDGVERVALVPLNPDFPSKEADVSTVLGVMTGLYRAT